MSGYAVGVDVGGTFTDAVAADANGNVFAAKTPSTPPNFGGGVLTVVDELAEVAGVSTEQLLGDTKLFAHGTTSSINALVQRKGAKVGFLTTKGHRDSMYIMNVEGRFLGRTPREVQDIMRARKPEPLVPKALAVEVTERIDAAGNVVVPLDEADTEDAVKRLLDDGVEAIAVSLLWSFRNPAHELRIREIAQAIAPDLYIALSCEVSPRIREFARSATTVMNSQIGPSLRDYLAPLEGALLERGLRVPILVMQSSGGTITAKEAPASAITTVGSVLSGGVIGSLRLAEQLGHENVITTDVGGTTFLAGLIVDGKPVEETQTIVNHHPVNVASLRIEAIGSGGGAIASVDEFRNLHVGPQSAEAVPGPACYGQGGTLPTNTDANLVLGILSERGLLDGRRPLRKDLAEQALREHVAEPLDMSVEDAAATIYAVQNAQTGDLLRKVVVEAGHDPRDFVVYAFGGAGPAHCAAYARELGIRQVIVPLGSVASAFSAYGLAASDIQLSAEVSDPSPFPTDAGRVQEIFDDLERGVTDKLERQNVEYASVVLRREVELRYTMQMFELPVPVPAGEITEASLADTAEAFHELYARRNGKGTGFREAGLQALTYRAVLNAKLPIELSLPSVAQMNGSRPADAVVERRPVRLELGTGFTETPIYDYRRLAAGHVIEGPAIIQVPTTSVVVPPSTTGTVDALGNLVITYDTGETR